MLPVFKIFSLILRTFSRPLVNYTKQYQNSNKQRLNGRLRNIFIRLGIRYNTMEMYLNRKWLRTAAPDNAVFIKPISDDVALEKGVEFFYELLFYGIILSLPLYEMWSQQVINQRKSDELNKRLNSLDNEVNVLNEKENHHNQLLITKMHNLESLIVGSDKSSEEVVREILNLKLEINRLVEIQQKGYEKRSVALNA